MTSISTLAVRAAGVGLLSASLALGSSAHAQSTGQYRTLELADGRTLIAEILATEATGLLMATPQGHSVVSFELLRDMAPTDRAAYERQDDWLVHIGGDPELVPSLVEAFEAIPAVRVARVDEAGDGVTPGQAAAAARCELDVDCVARTLADGTWRWIVMVSPSSQNEGGIRLVSAVTTGNLRHRVEAPSALGADLWVAAHDAILLKTTSNPPRQLRVGGGSALPSPRPATRAEPSPLAQALIPVPGIHALREGDGAGFATALGIVVPTTALWVGAVGHNAQSAPEAAVLSVAGFYAATILANQITGPGARKKSAATAR